MIQEFIGTGYVLNQSRTKILLVHHKKFGKWMPPGGHCDENESPHEAARREVLEETGVRADFVYGEDTKLGELSGDEEQVPSPIFVLKEFIAGKFGKGEDHFHIDFIYLMETKDEKLVKNEKETLALGWFDKNEIEHLPTFPAFRAIAEKII